MEEVQTILGLCTLLNYGLLIFWFAMFILAHDWIERFHGRWFSLTRETFDAIHYSLMGAFKLGIFLLNLVPYVSLRIAG